MPTGPTVPATAFSLAFMGSISFSGREAAIQRRMCGGKSRSLLSIGSTVIVRWGLPDIESIQPIRACRSSEVVVVSISDGGRYAVGVLTVAMGLLVPTGVGWAASAGAAPAGVPTQLAITTQPPSTLLFNQPFTIGVSVEDSSGNLV